MGKNISNNTLGLVEFLYLRSGATGIVANTKNSAKDLNKIGDAPIYFLEKNDFVSMKDGEKQPFNNEFMLDKIYLQNTKPQMTSRSMLNKVTNEALLSLRVDNKKSAVPALMRTSRHRRLTGFDEKGRSLIIGGQLTNIPRRLKTLRCLAVVPHYNEKDMVMQTIEHLLNEGLDVHVVDNWSDDGSFEIIQALCKKNSRVSTERFPSKDAKKYVWVEILDRIACIAKEKIGEYDWVMMNDADEIRRSPWKNVKLAAAFTHISIRGYNAVDFTVFNMRPTKDGYDGSQKITKYFKFGEFGKEPFSFYQVKAWQNYSEVNLSGSAGHRVEFEGLRIFPIKFLTLHYPLRSNFQANKKIYKERLPRYLKSEVKKGWHTHYEDVNQAKSFIYDESKLMRTNDSFWDHNIIERISGVGVVEHD